MEQYTGICVCLSHKVDKPYLIKAIADILKIDESLISLLDISQDPDAHFDTFIEYVEAKTNIYEVILNISIPKKYFNPKLKELVFGKAMANELQMEVFVPAPEFYIFDIIKILPNGNLLGGREYDDGDESCFNNFKLLSKTDIKKLEELFNLDVEPEITEKDNCIKAEILI